MFIIKVERRPIEKEGQVGEDTDTSEETNNTRPRFSNRLATRTDPGNSFPDDDCLEPHVLCDIIRISGTLLLKGHDILERWNSS